MIYSQERNRLRGIWREAWRKARAGEPIDSLEQLLVHTVAEHPEYHTILEDPEDRDCSDEPNPFFHLGLHLAVRESIATDRPSGVSEIHHILAIRIGDGHTAEHRIMECLAETLWQAQRNGRPPDEQAYLNCMRSLMQH